MKRPKRDLPSTKVCPICEEEFERPASYYNSAWASKRYCGPACAGEAKRRKWRAKWPSKPCAICGEEFQARAADMRWRVTCGKPECRRRHRVEIQAPAQAEQMRKDYASGKRKPARGVSEREEVLWESLRGGGWYWRMRWFDDFGCFELDFCLLERKVNVEIDGPEHQHRRRRELDEIRDAELRRRGWRILRIPNDEVDADPVAVLERVEAWVSDIRE